MANMQKLQKWAEAQKRHRLTDKQVLMARELGMNPDKLRKIDNHKQERWKAPLPEFIEELYYKRFRKDTPNATKPVREMIAGIKAEKDMRRKSGGSFQLPSEEFPQCACDETFPSEEDLAWARAEDFAREENLAREENASDKAAECSRNSGIPYKLAVLVFIGNAAGEQLLIHRAKSPNLGAWSPIGGKLETAIGESPYECAVRETREETGFEITTADLHLFCMIAEKSYEGSGHWLLFLFRCKKPIPALPPAIDEGEFAFFTRAAMEKINIPETDRAALWPIYDNHRDGFVTLNVDCNPANPLRVVTEEIF